MKTQKRTKNNNTIVKNNIASSQIGNIGASSMLGIIILAFPVQAQTKRRQPKKQQPLKYIKWTVNASMQQNQQETNDNTQNSWNQ